MGYLENGGCKSHAVFAGSSLAFIAYILHHVDTANFSRACRRVSYLTAPPPLENDPCPPTIVVRDFFLDVGAATPIARMRFNLTPFVVAALVLLCWRRFQVCHRVLYPILPHSCPPRFRLTLAGASVRAGFGLSCPATAVALCPHLILLISHYFLPHLTSKSYQARQSCP
jgi:hypothetical protein